MTACVLSVVLPVFRYTAATALVVLLSAPAPAQVPFDVLHAFTLTTDPWTPATAPLVDGGDGNLYGITVQGGAANRGTIFRWNPDTPLSKTVLHEFSASEGSPVNLMRASDGDLYGITTTASSSDYGFPSVFFRMTLDGVFTIVTSSSSLSYCCLIASATPIRQGPDGNFYFRTGPLFRITPAGSLTIFENLLVPVYVIASDGNFYMGYGLGANYSIARKTLTGATTILHMFTGGADGGIPNALVQASDGNFYGTTTVGGAFGAGTVFRITPAGDLTTLHSFTVNPQVSSLLSASDGNIYGTTIGSFTGGALDGGTIFRLSLDGAITVLHTRGIGGAAPGPLIETSAGTFYGTSGLLRGRGQAQAGTIFKATSSGNVMLAHRFTRGPYGLSAPLTQAADGNLYGTTTSGGIGSGTVFRMTADGTVSVLHMFDRSDGAVPQTALVKARDGFLYGVTSEGTESDGGTVFRIGPSGSVGDLHTLNRDTEGADASALIAATDGFLYGTTSSGGPFGAGTAFRMALDGTVTVLHGVHRRTRRIEPFGPFRSRRRLSVRNGHD